ncbi:MAG: four helix bundle protein [Gemmatimonadaceae bacterium]
MNSKARPPKPHFADHRGLIVGQKAIDLAVEVNRVSRLLPRSERYGVAQQMRAAAVSIAANIAEGKSRNQPRDYVRFLAIARGSSRELDTYFVVSRRSRFLRDPDLAIAEGLLDQVVRMLTTLMRRLTPL